MSAFTAWTYPIRGVVLLITTPQLLKALGHFLAAITGCSLLAVLVGVLLSCSVAAGSGDEWAYWHKVFLPCYLWASNVVDLFRGSATGSMMARTAFLIASSLVLPACPLGPM